MTPKKRNKIKKPKRNTFHKLDVECSNLYPSVYLNGWETNLEIIKGVHKWLGQAIAYLEQEMKKK